MATLAGARLTESHRLAQARIGVATVRQMLSAWSLIDVNRLDATVPDWLRVVIPLIDAQRVRSASLAAAYIQAFSRIELPGVTPPPSIVAGPVDVAVATSSLSVTGPVSLKRAMTAGTDLVRAAETAQTNTARAGMRHALAAGRETIVATVEADPIAAGYRRVTSGDACKFCSNLASRGQVYSAATRDFAAHDGCSCSSEPVFRDGTAGERRRVADFVSRDLTPAQREAANRRVREWVASTRN